MLLRNTLTLEQRLQRNVAEIVNHPNYIAMSGVMLIGKKEFVDSGPLACTDGRDEKYLRSFIDTQNDKQFRYILIHECYHKAERHLPDYQWMWEIDGNLANVAFDQAINSRISADHKHDDFVEFPTDENGKPIGIVPDPKFAGMAATQIFNIMLKEQEGKGKGNKPEQGDGEPGQPGQPLDHHDFENAKEMDEQDTNDLRLEIDEALRQGAVSAGKMGAGKNRFVEQLTQPKVNWRQVLREFVTDNVAGDDDSTWDRLDRRYIAEDIYMPGATSETMAILGLGADTSGSMGQRELTAILSEVVGVTKVCPPDVLHMFYWDAEVAAHEIYQRDDLERLAQSTKPAGGGGTDPRCVIDYMREKSIKPQCMVMFTDGYIGSDWGTWTMPVLWVVIDNPGATAPCGKTLHINSADLR